MFLYSTIRRFIFIACLLAAVPACAGEYNFNIPPQAMAASLENLARQGKVRLMYSPEAVRGLTAPAVRGTMTPEQAVARLLAGTGLRWVASENVIAVKAPRRDDSSSDSGYEIVVSATRSEHTVNEVPASASVLTPEDFKTRNSQNLYDALRDIEGLDFNEQPSVGHQTYPVIRGVGGSFVGGTTQVLLDGMPQDAVASNIIGHGGLNFMDMQDVERLELVRGPSSALYGFGAVGGVINVIPKRWKGDAGVELNASYGSHNTRKLAAAAGAATGKFDVRLSVYDASSDGYIAKPERDMFGTIDYGPRDWTDRKIALIGGYSITEDQELTFSYHRFDTDSALNGGDRPFNRQTFHGESARLGYAIDLTDDTRVKAQVQKTTLNQKYQFDEEDWNGLIGNFALAFSGGRYSDTSSASLELDSRVTESNHVIAGISYDSGDAETRNGTPAVIGNSKNKTMAAYLQDEISLGSFMLTGGVRYDRIDLSPITTNGVPVNGSGSVDNVISPRLGMVYKLDESNSFYASVGSAFLPALNNFKFVQPSVTRVDNPDLKPEKSISYEIGMNNDFGWGRFRTSVYRTEFKDKIALGIDTVSGLNQWQNLALRRVTGLELSFEGSFGGWKPYINFTHIEAEDQSKAGAAFTRATRVAPRKLNLGVTYDHGEMWSATLNGRGVSDMYFNNLTAAQHTAGYFIADAKMNVTLPYIGDNKWTAFLAVNNIGGKKYQPFNIGEWSDGRTFSIGLSGKL